MGAKIEFFEPEVPDPKSFYNFNYEMDVSYKQAIRIYGPKVLHNAVLTVPDLRAGATVVLGALIANGQSVVFGTEHLERGYENFPERLRSLGADIEESTEEF
jgi:UDP-N-acetylglucosamine 1-carboxyvinyltransferase